MAFVWKCECGHIETDEDAIEECIKCSRLDSFVKIPRALMEEPEEIEDALDEIEEDLEKKQAKKPEKSPKIKKPRRKKR